MIESTDPHSPPPSAAVTVTRSPAVAHGYVDGPLRLHHLDFGGDGEPLLLVHGVTGHAGAWHGVGSALTHVAHPIAVDLRGHGASQWSNSHAYATSDHASDLATIIDALGAPKVSIAGSSWGALIALAYTAAHPERVRTLSLVDIEPSFTQSETEVFARPRWFADMAEVLAFERSRNPNAPERHLHLVAEASVRAGADGRLEPWFDPYFYEIWPFRSDDWWAAVAEVEVPTLVVQAGQSFVRPEITTKMAALLPNGRHATIDQTTHVIPVDAPDALAGLLRDFVTDAD
jgi:pimeloyl-ACP methyl ester carboxylesterase